MKIVQSLEESGALIKGVSETIKNEGKEQKRGFLGMSLVTLATSIFGNMLAGKPKIPGWGVIKSGERVIQAGERKTRAI